MKIPALLFALLLACAPHAPRSPLQRRWIAESLLDGDTATANQALVGVALMGELATPLLPDILARADRGDLDGGRLADALEAMGPEAAPAVQVALARNPAWSDAGVMALARLGPPGGEALLALSRSPAVGAPAFAALRMAVGWALHPWVEPGQRQRHPYLVPLTMFTPLDLPRQQAEIVAVTCEILKLNREPGRGRAVAVLEALSDTSCVLPMLRGEDPHLRDIALSALPQQLPGAEVGAREALLLLGEAPNPEAVDVDRVGLVRYLLVVKSVLPSVDEELLRLLEQGPSATLQALVSVLGGQPPSPVQRQALMARLRKEAVTGDRLAALSWLGRQRTQDVELWEMFLAAADLGDAAYEVARTALVNMGEDAWSWLDAAVRDPARSSPQRLLAVQALPTPRSPACEALLLSVLRQGEPELRALAARILGESESANAYLPNRARLPALLAALSGDPVPQVRAAAAVALGHLARAGLDEAKIVRALQLAMKEPHRDVRLAAWRALEPASRGERPTP